MSLLTFKWSHKGDQYTFTGTASTSRSDQTAVDQELVEISHWLKSQKIPARSYTFSATRSIQTLKREVLTVENGAVVADGSTEFIPAKTEVVLTLPESAAVQFRFAFNVLDDRR